MPTNNRIDHTLQYVLNELIRRPSPAPQLIQGTREIIDIAHEIAIENNANELFQQFEWRTRDVDIKKDPNEVIPVDKEKAKSDGYKAVQHLRAMLSLVFTNSEVRKLLPDFNLIVRDLLARGTENAAASLAPNEE
jgi:hypothetical protein